MSSTLESYDQYLRDILNKIIKTNILEGSAAWTQATLPIKFGGLGIRSAIEVAPSAFLASTHSSSVLVNTILPQTMRVLPHAPYVAEAELCWSKDHNLQPLVGPAAKKQKAWDGLRAQSIAVSLLEHSANDEECACLLSVSTKESSAWLRALPVSNLGLRMDDNTVRIAVGLRLGTDICVPHSCKQCGADINKLGRHALSCRQSERRHQQHAELNQIIKRGFTAAKVPFKLEPTSLSRSDGKKPDGVTVTPWKHNYFLTWDTTFPDTFAPSYRVQATQGPGLVAAAAEESELDAYKDLPHSHTFTPVAVETLGAIGPQSISFLKELGERIFIETGNHKSTKYLFQRISVAVQRRNCKTIMMSDI